MVISLETKSKQRRCSSDCVGALWGVCPVSSLSTSITEHSLPHCFPPNSAFHHHWSFPSISSRFCPQSISISASSVFSAPSAFPSLHFSHHPHESPTYLLPPILLPYTLRSPGSLPPRWFVNSSLRRNQYYINKSQRAFALILYDLCGKDLRASVSSSGPLPELCC